MGWDSNDHRNSTLAHDANNRNSASTQDANSKNPTLAQDANNLSPYLDPWVFEEPITLEFNNTVGYVEESFNGINHGSSSAMNTYRAQWGLQEGGQGWLYDINDSSNTLLPGPDSESIPEYLEEVNLDANIGIIDNMIYWNEGVQSRDNILDILGIGSGNLLSMRKVYPSTEWYAWTGPAPTLVSSQLNTSASGWFTLKTNSLSPITLASSFTSNIKQMRSVGIANKSIMTKD